MSRPRTRKRVDQVWERIGRLKAKNQRVAQHYDIELDTDPSAERATAVRFSRRPVEGSMMTHPGVYCLRSNQTDWDEETLWRTYVTLTDLEAVFRSLKSELGLRPIFHHKPIRAEGHLFISVIAYQLVQLIVVGGIGVDDVCAKPATMRAGTPFDGSSKDNSASPPPSDAPMAARPCGMNRLVLLPQQCERHPLATQLAVDLAPVRNRESPGARRRCRIQPRNPASSSDSGSGQVSPCSFARTRYSLTVDGEAFRLRDTARTPNPAS